MCIKHPIGKRKCQKLMTIQEYEDKFSADEQAYVDDGIKPPSLELFNLEMMCIYGYNMELLYHLLQNPRRKKLWQRHNNCDPKYVLHISITRTLAAMVLTGEHTVYDIEKTLRLFYETGIGISSWVTSTNNTVSDKSFSKFKSVVFETAEFMILHMPDECNVDNLYLLKEDDI